MNLTRISGLGWVKITFTAVCLSGDDSTRSHSHNRCIDIHSPSNTTGSGHLHLQKTRAATVAEFTSASTACLFLADEHFSFN